MVTCETLTETDMRGQQKVFLGEVGDIVVRPPVTDEPLKNIDLNDERLTLRDLCNIALACHIDIKDLIGVKKCENHYGMVVLADKELPQGYNLFEHCVYCRNCFQYFREKRI